MANAVYQNKYSTHRNNFDILRSVSYFISTPTAAFKTFNLFSKVAKFIVIYSLKNGYAEKIVKTVEDVTHAFKFAKNGFILTKIPVSISKVSKTTEKYFVEEEGDSVSKWQLANDVSVLAADVIVLTQFGALLSLYSFQKKIKDRLGICASSAMLFSNLFNLVGSLGKNYNNWNNSAFVYKSRSNWLKTVHVEERNLYILETVTQLFSTMLTFSALAKDLTWLSVAFEVLVIPEAYLLGLGILLILMTVNNYFYKASMTYPEISAKK